jgi:Family of unknown function (DUF6326)
MKRELDDIQIHVRYKISALWTSIMFCYVYGDYFWLYVPGKLQEMLAGQMTPLGRTTPGVLVGTSVSMAIPAAMIYLSLVLPSWASRWTNIVVSGLYTLFVLLTMRGAEPFYLFLGSVDVILSLTLLWSAWTWPGRQAT